MKTNLEQEIKNRENLFEILDLNKCKSKLFSVFSNTPYIIYWYSFHHITVNGALDYNMTDELFDSLCLGCDSVLPTHNNFRLLLLLCDHQSTLDLWARIEKWHQECPEEQKRFPFRVVIWHLLGLQLSVNKLDSLYQNAEEISITYLRKHLSDLFSKAYKQNLPFF